MTNVINFPVQPVRVQMSTFDRIAVASAKEGIFLVLCPTCEKGHKQHEVDCTSSRKALPFCPVCGPTEWRYSLFAIDTLMEYWVSKGI